MTFYNFTSSEISLERLKLETSDFVHDWPSFSLAMTNCTANGLVQGHVTSENFGK